MNKLKHFLKVALARIGQWVIGFAASWALYTLFVLAFKATNSAAANFFFGVGVLQMMFAFFLMVLLGKVK